MHQSEIHSLVSGFAFFHLLPLIESIAVAKAWCGVCSRRRSVSRVAVIAVQTHMPRRPAIAITVCMRAVSCLYEEEDLCDKRVAVMNTQGIWLHKMRSVWTYGVLIFAGIAS